MSKATTIRFEQAPRSIQRLSLEDLPYPVLGVKPNLDMLFANKKALNLLGLPELPEVVDQPLSLTKYLANNLKEFFNWLMVPTTEPLQTRLFINRKIHHVVFYAQRHLDESGDFIVLSIHNNTEHIELAHEHELLKALLQHWPTPVLVLNSKYYPVMANDQFLKFFEDQPPRDCGLAYEHLFASEFYDQLFKAFSELVPGQHHTFTTVLKTEGDFSGVWSILLFSVQLRSEFFYFIRFEFINHEIEKIKSIEHKAYIDPLTGLNNRQSFYERFKEKFDEALRTGDTLAVLYLDIDKFKFLNDHYGHDYGDQLLTAFAKRLKNSLKADDLIGRVGGDEFVAVLEINSDIKTIDVIATNLIHHLSFPYRLKDMEYTICSSIGMAIYPEHSIELEELVKFADDAMLQAKKSGRNRYQLYNSDLQKLEQQKKSQFDKIQHAIENNQIELYFQPQISLKDQSIHSFETLARWKTETGEVLPPCEFLPAIEKTQLMIPLIKYQIRWLYTTIASLQFQGYQFSFALNFNSLQLQSPQVFKLLQSQAELHPRIAQCIEIEVTETSIFELDTQINNHLNALSNLGYQLTLDDFGTGYSSLFSLKKFHFSKVKIDKSFIDDILEKSSNLIMLDAMVSMLNTLGYSLVYEGVEEKSQLEYLKPLGEHLVQGYYYEKPMPRKALLKYLKQHAQNK